MNTTKLIKLKNAPGTDGYLNTKILNEAGFACRDLTNPVSEVDTIDVFKKSDIDFLLDYIIRTEHAFAKEHAIIIYDLAQKVVNRHSYNHPELKKFGEVAFFFFHDLLNQMLQEEQNLFPYIRQLVKDIKKERKIATDAWKALPGKIAFQQNEHKKSLNYLKIFREITNNYQVPSDACCHYKSLFENMKELERNLKVHFHLEDDILYQELLFSNDENKIGELKFKVKRIHIIRPPKTDIPWF